MVQLIENHQKYIEDLKKKKIVSNKKLTEITDSYYFTALEYYLLKSSELITKKFKDKDKIHNLEEEKCCIC